MRERGRIVSTRLWVSEAVWKQPSAVPSSDFYLNLESCHLSSLKVHIELLLRLFGHLRDLRTERVLCCNQSIYLESPTRSKDKYALLKFLVSSDSVCDSEKSFWKHFRAHLGIWRFDSTGDSYEPAAL